MKQIVKIFIFIFLLGISQASAFDINDLDNYSEFAMKSLSTSDTPNKEKSANQEIYGVSQLRSFFGEEKVKFDTNIIYISDSKEVEDQSTITWYYSFLKKQQFKSYRIYYQKNIAMAEAYGGDIFIIARNDNNDYLSIVAKKGDEITSDIIKYLGLYDSPLKLATEKEIETSVSYKENNDKYSETETKILQNKSNKKLVVVGKVSKIYDGDTFILDNLFKVRMVGIDTPEKKQVCQDKYGKDFMCGEKSKKHLAKLLGKRKVFCEMHGWGAYNRHLFVCKNWKGEDVNKRMVEDGYAVMSTYKPFRYAEEEANAKNLSKGLWSGTFQHPSQWRKDRRNKKK
jgi:endonuclease YncB( thermonuclease family)